MHDTSCESYFLCAEPTTCLTYSTSDQSLDTGSPQKNTDHVSALQMDESATLSSAMLEERGLSSFKSTW